MDYRFLGSLFMVIGGFLSGSLSVGYNNSYFLFIIIPFYPIGLIFIHKHYKKLYKIE